jgi:SAM-dependent methyltransferase
MESSRSKSREPFSEATWGELLRRWRQGVYRPSFFRDMILTDVRRLGPEPALLDIGCGRGFDGQPEFQRSLAELAGQYVGIEPDASVSVLDCHTQVHRCPLEDAPLASASIDVAFAVFVIEHLRCPQIFFETVFETLSDGGIFWGFTIDLRHFFALMSLAAEGLGVKEWCLTRLGETETIRGPGHYRTFYRANTPCAIRRCAGRFRSVRMMNLHQTGQFDAYLPQWARTGGRWLDRLTAALRLPGPMLVVRLEK